MTVIINIVLILVSLVLIAAVLMQEGNKQGLGAIGGAAETFLGKNKSKGYEGKLLTITKIAAVVFVVIAILATWLNARTYTVRYFNEDGTEYYPRAAAQAEFMTYYNGVETTYEEAVASMSEEDLVDKYGYGDEVYTYPAPAKEGYVGAWDVTLPEKMDRSDYELHPVYTIGTYTITVQQTTVPDENGDVETTEIYSVEGEYQSEVDVASIQDVIDAVEEVEGYEKKVSAEIPATMPGVNTVIKVTYELPAAEEPEAEETDEAEDTEADEAEEEAEPVDEVAEEAPVETEKEPAPATEE